MQGQGLARALLADGFARVAQAREQIGVRGILVHAASPAATAFNLHVGFEASPLDSTTLMVRLADLGEVLGR